MVDRSQSIGEDHLPPSAITSIHLATFRDCFYSTLYPWTEFEYHHFTMSEWAGDGDAAPGDEGSPVVDLQLQITELNRKYDEAMATIAALGNGSTRSRECKIQPFSGDVSKDGWLVSWWVHWGGWMCNLSQRSEYWWKCTFHTVSVEGVILSGSVVTHGWGVKVAQWPVLVSKGSLYRKAHVHYCIYLVMYWNKNKTPFQRIKMIKLSENS
jgi:hypothetical protein